MKQIIHIAVNNVVRSKLKAVAIVMLMALSMFTATLGYSFSQSATYTVEKKADELEMLSSIKVLSYNQGDYIAMSTIELIEEMEGVSFVLPQYNIGGLLEESEGKPIYQVSVNGFDFEERQFVGAEDYRGQGVSGIILPDISYEFMDEVTLKEYVGQQIYFTYEYLKDGQYISETVTCKVIGVYKASGVFENNPVYMSMDLFGEILENVGHSISGVSRAIVYMDNVADMDRISENIGAIGLEVNYETTLDDYISSLEGFITLGVTVAVIIMVFAVIVMIQAILSNIGKRYDIIGVLKAYGYSNGKICFMVWFEVFIYSIIAVVVSLICGYAFSDGLNNFFDTFISGAEFAVGIKEILLNVLVGVVVSGVASIIPVRRLKKIDVIDVLKSN